MPHSSAENMITLATDGGGAAALAGGIIAASGGPWTISESMTLLTDVTFAMHLPPGDCHYGFWKPTRDERLKEIHT
jgi:hypothetical protein